jgi:hypothetical protein
MSDFYKVKVKVRYLDGPDAGAVVWKVHNVSEYKLDGFIEGVKSQIENKYEPLDTAYLEHGLKVRYIVLDYEANYSYTLSREPESDDYRSRHYYDSTPTRRGWEF